MVTTLANDLATLRERNVDKKMRRFLRMYSGAIVAGRCGVCRRVVIGNGLESRT